MKVQGRVTQNKMSEEKEKRRDNGSGGSKYNR
jgi:hypothetical protein